MEDINATAPEIGLWLKETAQGLGYGTEIVETIVCWAAGYLGKTAFTYPVALDNIASRRISERLGGTIVGKRRGSKYDSVVYLIPSSGSVAD